MKVVVLAGGLGTRLAEELEGEPKPFELLVVEQGISPRINDLPSEIVNYDSHAMGVLFMGSSPNPAGGTDA
jgi:hypothetical protein